MRRLKKEKKLTTVRVGHFSLEKRRLKTQTEYSEMTIRSEFLRKCFFKRTLPLWNTLVLYEKVFLFIHEGKMGASLTGRRLSTGKFSTKNVTHQHGFKPRTSCLPSSRTTNCAMVTRIWTKKIATHTMIFL